MGQKQRRYFRVAFLLLLPDPVTCLSGSLMLVRNCECACCISSSASRSPRIAGDNRLFSGASANHGCSNTSSTERRAAGSTVSSLSETRTSSQSGASIFRPITNQEKQVPREKQSWLMVQRVLERGPSAANQRPVKTAANQKPAFHPVQIKATEFAGIVKWAEISRAKSGRIAFINFGRHFRCR